MQGIQLLLTPFVWVLMLFYELFDNYGIALILFAVLVKVILFPLSIKAKRSMIQMNMLNGQMQKLQKMYGNNREKYNLEVQKLYEKEKVNPMGGCLWSLLPLVILLPLYAIIRQPLTYLMNLTPDVIAEVAHVVDWNNAAVANGWIKEAADFVNAGYNQLYLASLITPDNIGAVQAVAEGARVINFSFLGMDLAQMPQWQFWTWSSVDWAHIGLFLLPIVSAASGLLFSFITMKTNAINRQSENAAVNSTNKTMLIISPLMSLWIGFAMPAGLSIYWVSQNVLSMLQEFLAGKLLKKDYEKAAEQAAIREAEEKEEEKRRREEERAERARRIEEAKNNKGKKKGPKTPKDPDENKIPASVREASRVGIRAYARGRAYDPYRFSPDGPTLYQQLDGTIVENAQDKKLERKSEVREEAALEQAADQMIVDELKAEQAAQAPAEAPAEDAGTTQAPGFETPHYDAPDYDASGEDGKQS
ncbi:MAG: YidC/Oxa1 family membrane protein insertase [Pseudoflavonifractor capillosus]|uniref:YidC/Oxa1 family membrane protein insertase n=1 Tax=Pseudoflavonifractor capillosus TaxID=106588 RepID=UPI0023F9A596|nr:YidC/Oxa1 family membrane protein insertase [Pseudoflavonifractor capillosus]MCI5929243.1 YidC/Oxa1 family membrane protein insertase [Pseudoflavonifractor capillosus]MDY4660004.1 YidC/Oxa1 family membrane protein insertase [Pseudoflavonifractor capillosus]